MRTFAPISRRSLVHSLVSSIMPVTAKPACLPCVFRSTLLQLLRQDAERSASAWFSLMRDLRGFGLREVVVQWTYIDGIAFYGGPGKGSSGAAQVLPTLLAAARSAGLRCWIGLNHDPSWWSAAARPDAALDAWFTSRLSALDATLPALSATLAAGSRHVVAGWYVPDELDDATWSATPREAALIRYLSAVSERLGQLAPRRPIAISAFANGAQEPLQYGSQLRRIGRAAGITRLLLQDGIGAGKRTPEQARATALGVSQALRSSSLDLGVVVELFDMRRVQGTSVIEPATSPASIPTILARLAATADIGTLPPASFSHVHHLSAFGGPEAAERGAQWKRLLGQHLVQVIPPWDSG